MSNNKILTDEEIWKIINEKYNDKNDYTKDFIFRSIKKYGDIFIYEKSHREKWTDTVIVTCSIHGDFKVYPNNYLNEIGCGCPKCKRIENSKLHLMKEADNFEKKLKKKYPHFSIIDKNEYKGSRENLSFRCNLDGCIFSSKPINVLDRTTKILCPSCKKEKIRKEQESIFINQLNKHFTDGELLKNEKGHYWENAECNIIIKSKYTGEVREFPIFGIYQRIRRGTTELFESTRKFKRRENFIRKSIEKYGDNFRYDKIELLDNYHLSSKVIVVCSHCGKELTVSCQSFLLWNTKCICQIIHEKFIDLSNILKPYNISILTTEQELIQLGNLTDNTIISLRCNTCGSIFKLPVKYIKVKARKNYFICKNCNKSKSIGEELINSWLKDNNFKFRREVRLNCIIGRNINLVIVDFELYVNGKKCIIEYNGEQHYRRGDFFNILKEDFEKQVKRDINLRNYCIDNNILFIEIPYTFRSKKSISTVLKEILLNNKNPQDVIKIPKIEEL